MTSDDERYMACALRAAATSRTVSPPNPWVGAVLVTERGAYEGATAAPGGPHAEATALTRAREAGDDVTGATLYTTLEPCAHVGRTPPCAEAIVRAGVARVVVAVTDPDERVAGRGIEALQRGGVDVTVGTASLDAAAQLAPYLKHRRTGRPWVVLKLAATFDGRIAAPDGSSKWITGAAARSDAHRLRAESEAVLVGAGTVRADDPALTVRDAPCARQPLRVVLGRAPEGASIQPALELNGDLHEALDQLGGMGVLQLLVEGGAHVAHDLHAAGLVDRYVLYLAPALFGGDDALGLFAGPGAPTMAEVWRGRIVSATHLGEDLRVDLARRDEGSP